MKRGLSFKTRQLLQAVVSSKHNAMFKMYIIRAHCDRQRYSHCLFQSINWKPVCVFTLPLLLSVPMDKRYLLGGLNICK